MSSAAPTNRLAWGARACALVLALSVSACGGSSSETPPPLEPDPKRLAESGPEDDRQPDGAGQSNDDDSERSTEGKPTPPRTWGSDPPPSDGLPERSYPDE